VLTKLENLTHLDLPDSWGLGLGFDGGPDLEIPILARTAGYSYAKSLRKAPKQQRKVGYRGGEFAAFD
jgi:hypothetical protein